MNIYKTNPWFLIVSVGEVTKEIQSAMKLWQLVLCLLWKSILKFSSSFHKVVRLFIIGVVPVCDRSSLLYKGEECANHKEIWKQVLSIPKFSQLSGSKRSKMIRLHLTALRLIFQNGRLSLRWRNVNKRRSYCHCCRRFYSDNWCFQLISINIWNILLT